MAIDNMQMAIVTTLFLLYYNLYRKIIDFSLYSIHTSFYISLEIIYIVVYIDFLENCCLRTVLRWGTRINLR